MNDIDFKSFSTRSFERFAQALTMHVLGAGIMVFGDGPDGAREATFDGILSYPSTEDKWAGYTVMQAKFLQVAKSPYDDANWLVGQLDAELAKYLAPKSGLRKPEYYILVTNARLSPVPKTKKGAGGIAKIDEVFEKYQTALGLKAWRVWHLDQLTTMLSNAEPLRRSYAAWLTSSDVIAKLLEGLEASSQALKKGIYRYLARELRSHQPVRLQQAGHGGDARTMIEDVFSDLPFRFSTENIDNLDDILLLSHLLERSRDKLDSKSVNSQSYRNRGRPERVLLIGGPGQGKSTVTQFLAQIFRANMLLLDSSDEVSPEVRSIVEGTLRKASAMGLPIAIPKRFPLRVDLPAFADSLSRQGQSGGSVTLIGFLSSQISTTSDTIVDREAVRTWLRDYPNVLILDGLDEVPASANRTDVIRAINEFWDDLASTDTLMIVTTRPQGYNDDLDPTFYSKLEMTPLQPAQAIACAEKLAIDRIVDPIQRERVMSRLREASGSPTTARLMVSPLQVAIMLALIDQRGDAPTDRWSLFDKYFAVVLEREQSKPGPIGKAMRHWGRQIVAVHHKAGFLLHVEAETQGNAEAHLTSGEFESLIRGQLSDEGFEDDELDASTVELVSVSTERLVLLVQREEERFTFEVRSLQEFMAAAHLMTGREAIVQKRLGNIANRTHWLHVFQIAASKCFAVADAEQYRDTVIALCNDLNANGEAMDRLLRSGSRLALALLDDGLAYDAPKYRRLLFFLALELIETGPATLPHSLSDHCDREPARTIEKLRPYFVSSLEPRVRGAWRLVMWCAIREQSWAEALLKEFWPTESAKMVDPLRESVEAPENTWLFARIKEATAASKPEDVRQAVLISWEGRSHRNFGYKGLPAVKLLVGNLDRETCVPLFIGGRETPLSLRFCPIQVLPWQRQGYDDIPENEQWAPICRLRDFHNAPSAAALADLLDAACANGWLDLYDKIRINLPWPLATLVHLCVDEGRSAEAIAALRVGAFGDLEDWLKAEERWSRSGVTEADLALSASGVFFDGRVAQTGFPWAGLNLSHRANEPNDWVDELVNLSSAATDGPHRWLNGLVQFVLPVYVPANPLTVDATLDLLTPVRGKRGDERIDPSVIQSFSADILASPLILDRLAELGVRGQFFISSGGSYGKECYEILASALVDRPHLLILLSTMICADERESQFHWIPVHYAENAQIESSSIMAGFARVLLLARGSDDQSLMRYIICEDETEFLESPIALLQQCLENRWVREETKRRIGELVADLMNVNQAMIRQNFMISIQSIANTRVSALQEPECWLGLELGTFLLELMQRRRGG
jgi:hypothetical protein